MIKITLLLSLYLCSFLSYATTYYSLGSDREVLGAGFEQALRMPLDSCLDGDWVYQGGSEGGLVYQGSFDANSMIYSMTGSIKASVDLILFGGSVKYSVRNKVTENTNSIGSTMVLNYNKGSYNFENRRVKPAITSLLQSDPVAARNKCGDGFIHHVKLGSNLYVSAKLHFKDRAEYQWAQTKIKVKVLFWSKTTTKTKEFYEATKDAVYSIQANTDGGMTTKLAQLTSGGPRYCKTDNMDACIDYADELFAYLLEDGDYADDLNDSHLNNMTYDVASYEKSGHYSLAYGRPLNLSKRYIELSERLRVYQDFVNDEMQSTRAFLAVEEDEAQITRLTLRLAQRDQQKTALDASAEYCYGLPGTSLCEQHMEASIETVN
jgi:hypothetical protein